MGKMAWKILGDTRRRKGGRASRHKYHKGREFCMGLKESGWVSGNQEEGVHCGIVEEKRQPPLEKD